MPPARCSRSHSTQARQHLLHTSPNRTRTWGKWAAQVVCRGVHAAICHPNEDFPKALRNMATAARTPEASHRPPTGTGTRQPVIILESKA
jgi:hypothetical protein